MRNSFMRTALCGAALLVGGALNAPAFAQQMLVDYLPKYLPKAPALNGEVMLGLGYEGVTDPSGDLVIGVEYRAAPLYRFGPLELRPGAGAELSTEAAFWAGGGLALRAPINPALYIEGSFMPGLYLHGGGPDLGGPLEFRSRIEASYALSAQTRLGLAFEHKSNGGIHSDNPGVDTLFATWGLRF